MDWLTKWLGYPKRVGQATITLTPDFMLANIARDTIMGAVMSRSGFRPVIDSLKGMRLRMTENPLYKDYIANGGGLSSLYLDEHHLRTKLEKFYTSQGIDARTVLDTPDKLLGFIETLGDAFEMSTRLGEYDRAHQAWRTSSPCRLPGPGSVDRLRYAWRQQGARLHVRHSDVPAPCG